MKSHIWSKIAKTALVAASLTVVLQTATVHADAVHKAKEGDTFYLLAKKYGVNMYKLMNANKSIDPYNIYEGLDIIIPGVKTTALTAKANTQSKLNVSSANKVVEAWGKTFNYSRTINVVATAYSAAPEENGGWGPVDYFGNPLKLGTIAVDPNVIPMGTKVLVTGHSHAGLPKDAFVATATDQGSAIKGNRIDIFIPGSPEFVDTFGYQDVKLYVLK